MDERSLIIALDAVDERRPVPVASVVVSPRGKPNAEARALLLSAAERLIGATLLVGACHDLALQHALHRDESPASPALAHRLVDTLLTGLHPT